MSNVIMVQGDWDETAKEFLRTTEYSQWSGEKYFGSTIDGKMYFLFILNHTRYDYVPNEKWVEVSVIADWKLMKDSFMSLNQRKKYRDIGIYKAMEWIFEEMQYDGMYGKVRENDKSVYLFMKRMNGARTKPLGESTSGGVPLHHWVFPKAEYQLLRPHFQKKAESAMLEF